jgi:hypothetical protein
MRIRFWLIALVIFFVTAFLNIPANAGPSCDNPDPSLYERVRSISAGGYVFDEYISHEPGCERTPGLFDIAYVDVIAPSGDKIDKIPYNHWPIGDVHARAEFVSLSIFVGGSGCGESTRYYSLNKPYKKLGDFCGSGFWENSIIIKGRFNPPGPFRGMVSTIYVSHVISVIEGELAIDPLLTWQYHKMSEKKALDMAASLAKQIDAETNKLGDIDPSLVNDFLNLVYLLAYSKKPDLAVTVMEKVWGGNRDRGSDWDMIVDEINSIQVQIISRSLSRNPPPTLLKGLWNEIKFWMAIKRYELHIWVEDF